MQNDTTIYNNLMDSLQDAVKYSKGDNVEGIVVNKRSIPDGIYGFSDDYRQLSNFDMTPFILTVGEKIIRFPSGEHAFQYFKTFDKEWQDKILSAETPGKAKRFGRQCPLRDDWNNCKDDIMEKIVFNKFYQNNDLLKLLLSTGNKYLEETNNWNDTYWGVCNGVGENNLGKILMRVRDCIRRYNTIIHRGY